MKHDIIVAIDSKCQIQRHYPLIIVLKIKLQQI